MNGEQARLSGSRLSVEEVEENGPKCSYHDTETGERCDYYAVVRVDTGDGEILACPYHGKRSWLDAAGVTDRA